jgi:hypothetical protein
MDMNSQVASSENSTPKNKERERTEERFLCKQRQFEGEQNR